MRPSRSDAPVAVIGAGPAGLAAAVTAAEHGASVTLVDAESGPGGQFWRQPLPGLRSDAGTAGRNLYHDLRRFDALRGRLAAAERSGELTYLPGHQVWSLERSPESERRFLLRVTSGHAGTAATGAGSAEHARNDAVTTIAADTLVLAPGAYDLPLPFPGWDLPGVLTAGGAQALLKEHDVVAGQRVLVAGTGPFLLPVAAGLARSGATVLGVHEAAAPTRWLRELRAVAGVPGKLVEGAGYAATLLRSRVGYHTRSTVVAADGDHRVRGVTTARLDRSGRELPGTRQRIEADVLAVGWGFVPQLELPLALGCRTVIGPHGIPVIDTDGDQRTDVAGVLVAGEACGVGGAALAVVEGVIAGTVAAGASPPADARRDRTSLRRFAAAMHRAHPVPTQWTDTVAEDTVICRCEEVTAAVLRDAAAGDGVTDARTAKLLTRSGLGWCQGRMCAYATGCLLAAGGPVNATRSPTPFAHSPVTRSVATPVPLGEVAAHRPGQGR